MIFSLPTSSVFFPLPNAQYDLWNSSISNWNSKRWLHFHCTNISTQKFIKYAERRRMIEIFSYQTNIYQPKWAINWSKCCGVNIWFTQWKKLGTVKMLRFFFLARPTYVFAKPSDWCYYAEMKAHTVFAVIQFATYHLWRRQRNQTGVASLTIFCGY